MLTSLSFLCAQRKGAPDYSPETREQPVALLAQPASNERPLLEGEPLSLCSDLLRVSVPIPTVSSEGQKSKIFRDTPRSLCRRSLLFTEVRGRDCMKSSWRSPDGGSSVAPNTKIEPSEAVFRAWWSTASTPIRSFHTVSEGEFSEVRPKDKPVGGCA